MARVVLAMSGGVDSSVAAALLQAAGHEVIGVFMRHGEQSPVACAAGPAAAESSTSSSSSTTLPLRVLAPARADHKQGCCSAADAEDGRRVAERLDIPFYALNLEEEFRQIIDYFVDEYTVGRTPNPCVVCNNWLKFGRLFDYADSVGAEFVATGHYAQLESAGAQSCVHEGGPALLRGRDAGKDQSYVLFGIDRARLKRMLLPVGGFCKSEIRTRAAELGLRVAEKRDSQEICFVTSGHHDEFVRAHRGEQETSGEIVTTDGTVVGRHAGIEGFTVGQRKGIGVALGDRRFVVRIEPESRRVVIGRREELARQELTATGTNWLCDEPRGAVRCLAQIRYKSPAQPATIEPLPGGRLRVRFDAPQHGVAPGQAVVCYDGPRVLGGGWIE